MKHPHNLNDFKTSTPFKENLLGHFKDHHIVKLLTNFDVNLTSVPGGVTNLGFINPPRNEVKLT